MPRESYQEEPLYSSISLVSYSAYEVKNNCFLFEWFLKIKRMGFSILNYLFFVLEIMTFRIMQMRKAMTSFVSLVGQHYYPVNQRSPFLISVLINIGLAAKPLS